MTQKQRRRLDWCRLYGQLGSRPAGLSIDELCGAPRAYGQLARRLSEMSMVVLLADPIYWTAEDRYE